MQISRRGVENFISAEARKISLVVLDGSQPGLGWEDEMEKVMGDQ